MTSALSLQKVSELNQSFSRLKLTAKSAEDIAKWFKKHPEMIPGLPLEHARKLRVENSSEEMTYDTKNKTAYDHQNFEFIIESINDKPARKTFSDITGIRLDENTSQLNSAYFAATYLINLDALEWKFVALEALTGMEDEDINDRQFNVIYQNILAKHYPHYQWNTFAALWQADLLPNDADELDRVLKRPAPTELMTAVPSDFSL